MFSKYISVIFQKLQFICSVIWRFLKIIFRKRKDIELLYINYNTEHIFENSFCIINYRFRNAIYYQFGDHKTLEKQIKIFNLKNIDQEFDLIVYGFFQKKSYHLKFKPNKSFNTSRFKTKIANLTLELKHQTIPKFSIQPVANIPSKLVLNQTDIRFQNNKIKLNHKTFNQNEFI